MKDFFGTEITDEEYDKILEDFSKHINEQRSFRNIQIDRISNFIRNLSQEEIELWMDKFLKWETKYEEFQYDHRQVQTSSNIFSALIDFVESKGKPIRIYKDEMFCTAGYKWNKYRFKLYQGQGAFWRILVGRKQIFANI